MKVRRDLKKPQIFHGDLLLWDFQRVWADMVRTIENVKTIGPTKKIKFIYVFLSYSAISEHHIFEKSNNTLFWGHIAHREHSRKSFKHKPSRPQHAFDLK